MELLGGLLMRKKWLRIIAALLFITVFIIVGSLTLKKLNTPDTGV